MANYQEQLQDIRWKKKRNKIFKRDEYKCTVCGSDNQLRVHHTYYTKQRSNPWEYPDNSLLTLCNECHEKYHKEHELTIRSHHKKSGKRKKINKVPDNVKLSLKQLYAIWEPKLKGKKYRLI